MLTTKEYLRDCCTIEPLWLCDVAPKLFKPVLLLLPPLLHVCCWHCCSYCCMRCCSGCDCTALGAVCVVYSFAAVGSGSVDLLVRLLLLVLVSLGAAGRPAASFSAEDAGTHRTPVQQIRRAECLEAVTQTGQEIAVPTSCCCSSRFSLLQQQLRLQFCRAAAAAADVLQQGYPLGLFKTCEGPFGCSSSECMCLHAAALEEGAANAVR